MVMVDFEDIKDRLEEIDEDVQTLVDRAAEELRKVYEDHHTTVMYDFYQAKVKTPYYAQKYQREILRQAQEGLKAFVADFGRELESHIEDAVEQGVSDARADLESLGYEVPQDSMEETKLELVNDISDMAMAYVSTQADRMAQQMKSTLKQQATAVMRRARGSGKSMKDAASDIEAEALKLEPKLQFIDRAGRRWDSKSYFDLVTRSTINNAVRESYTTAMIENGHDLVAIYSLQAVDRCLPHHGQIISLSGATEGYPTYDELKASGDIFHPRCRCRLIGVNSKGGSES